MTRHLFQAGRHISLEADRAGEELLQIVAPLYLRVDQAGGNSTADQWLGEEGRRGLELNAVMGEEAAFRSQTAY